MRSGSCLLVVDVQKGIFALKQPVHDAEGLIGRLETSIEKARRRGVPVFFTQHENPTFLDRGSSGWNIVNEIAPTEADVVIHKSKASAFEGTDLQHVLEGAGVSRLFIGGLISNGCIEATCLDALDLGFDVVLIQNAHSTFFKRAPTVIEAINTKLASRGVVLRPSSDLF